MIVATAGHVDHGKTRLVEALTGIDTDTLPEEKKRGLTIDIGFAYLPIEGQHGIGFIDVPGHDRFIKNALCGITAANFVLLVIAADDGPMPQTLEHLAIIDLLNVRSGAIVISKTDRVPADQIKSVALQIGLLVKNTTLKHWPTYQVSSDSNEGIGDLKAFLVQQGRTGIRSKSVDQSNFRMAVDRVFQKKGSGLIVTGTIFSGKVSIDDRVTIAGSAMQLRVRGLRIQNSESDFGHRGQRCAINLAGIELQKEKIKRGSWVTSPQVVAPVNRFDAEIEILNNSPCSLMHWMPVHLHLAASETTARIAVLEGESIAPGESGLVQVVCDHPPGTVFGDHFIVRDTSARFTLGGGRVIDIFPPRRGRASAERISFLQKANQSDARTALKALLDSCRDGVDLDQFGKNRNLTEQASSEMFKVIGMIVLEEGKHRIGFSEKFARTQGESILQSLKCCHQNAPEAKGFSESEILRQIKYKFPSRLLKGFLDRLLQQSLIRKDTGGYSLSSHFNNNNDNDELWSVVKEMLTTAGTRAISLAEIVKDIKLPEKQLNSILLRAARAGLVTKLSKTLLILPVYLHELHKLVEQLVDNSSNGLFSVAEFRDASGIGRNRCVEILECFDANGITERVDQSRQLLPAAKTVVGRMLNNGKDRTLVGRPVFKTGEGR